MKSLSEATDLDTPDSAALVLETIPAVMRILREEMRGSRMPDLSVPQFRALNFLYRCPGASLSDVADHVGTMLPSMSKLIDKLVERGLVIRREAPEDRRRVTLTLTESGRADLRTAREGVQERVRERLAALSPEEQATLAEAMRILRDAFLPEAMP